MRLRNDQFANRYRQIYPGALLANDVTVGELIQYLSGLPADMIVQAWDCYGDDRSSELDINPDFETNTVMIKG